MFSDSFRPRLVRTFNSFTFISAITFFVFFRDCLCRSLLGLLSREYFFPKTTICNIVVFWDGILFILEYVSSNVGMCCYEDTLVDGSLTDTSESDLTGNNNERHRF